MPTKPPSLRPKPVRKQSNWNRRASRQSRGYGREHERIRAELLQEEPLCRECAKVGRVTAATIADHIVPLSQGGSGERSNYAPICRPCHLLKVARESAAGRTKR